MKPEQVIRRINSLVPKEEDEGATIAELNKELDAIEVDGDIQNESDYGIHRQLDDAVWQVVPRRDYAMLANFVVNNPANTWQQPVPLNILCPQSLKGAIQAVKDAEQNGWKIRGLASCHSFSEAPRTKDCYIYLTDDVLINSIMGPRRHPVIQTSLTLLKSTFTFPAGTPARYRFTKKDLLEVAGGCTINELNDRLCPYDTALAEIKTARRLLNMGGGDVQTLAGAFATGTHGTGGKHSAYHDMIKSVLLVCTGGRVLRVEPANGITDPRLHEAYFAANPNEIKPELLQDDDLFNSLLVSFGSFGIVFSVIMETTQMDLLHEELVYTRSGYNKVKDSLPNLLPAFTDCRNDIFPSILLNPYKLKKNTAQSVTIKTVVTANDQPIKRRADTRNFWPKFMTGRKFTSEIMRGIANGPGNKRRIIEMALKNLSDNEDNGGNGYTDFSYRVWNSGGGETKSMGCGIEFAFRLTELPAALDKVFALLDTQYKPLSPANKHYLNSPMALRFVRSSEAYLAPNYKVHSDTTVHDTWCYIELLRINSRRDGDDVKEREIFFMLQDVLYKAGGRPHWGLNFNFPFNREYLKGLYPMLDKWIDAYKFFNPTGLFDNALTDRCGFRN